MTLPVIASTRPNRESPQSRAKPGAAEEQIPRIGKRLPRQPAIIADTTARIAVDGVEFFHVCAPMTSCHSDDDLLELTAQGDRHAFAMLMERHTRPMLALAQRISGNPDDAEELVQEAFLKVWTLASKWRRDGKAQFSTWLHRVVLNGCLDRRRRPTWTGLDEIAEVADTGPGATQCMARRQNQWLIQAAMGTIPERQRAALYLHYFSEITAPQAAQVLDISVPAMEALLIRGKRALKKELMRRGVTDIGDML